MSWIHQLFVRYPDVSMASSQRLLVDDQLGLKNTFDQVIEEQSRSPYRLWHSISKHRFLLVTTLIKPLL